MGSTCERARSARFRTPRIVAMCTSWRSELSPAALGRPYCEAVNAGGRPDHSRAAGDILVCHHDDDDPQGGVGPRPVVVRSNRTFTLGVRPGFAVRAAASPAFAIAMRGFAVEGLDSVVRRGLAVLDRARPGDEQRALAAYAASIDGHFCMAAMTADRVLLATDLLGSIPVYRATGTTGVVAGTALIDVVGHRAAEVDPASAVQFIRDGVITAPFTLFRGITRQAPASVDDAARQQIVQYWHPPRAGSSRPGPRGCGAG